MPTLLAGITNKRWRAGVTMIEMLIVVMLIALIAGVSYPAASSGLNTLRMRSASDSIATFLATAVDRAERGQQAVEIVISPKENTMVAISSDARFTRRLELSDSIRISNVLPAVAAVSAEEQQPRRFVIYPGGAAPRIGIQITTSNGGTRTVTVDPLTGFPRTVVAPQ